MAGYTITRGDWTYTFEQPQNKILGVNDSASRETVTADAQPYPTLPRFIDVHVDFSPLVQVGVRYRFNEIFAVDVPFLRNLVGQDRIIVDTNILLFTNYFDVYRKGVKFTGEYFHIDLAFDDQGYFITRKSFNNGGTVVNYDYDSLDDIELVPKPAFFQEADQNKIFRPYVGGNPLIAAKTYESYVDNSRYYQGAEFALDYSIRPVSSFFTQFADQRDFNALSEAERASIKDSTDLYHALGGDDAVRLPNTTTIQTSTGTKTWNPTVTFDAGAGDDRITSGRLNDRVDGGSDLFDVIAYTGGGFDPTNWVGQSNRSTHTNNGHFGGDYSFKLLGFTQDTAGKPGSIVEIAGPAATEGTDTVRNTEYFEHGLNSVPLAKFQFKIQLDGNGYGRISLFKNGKPAEGVPQNVLCAYDESLPLATGSYEVIYRYSAKLGWVFELADYSGKSWFNDRYNIELHGGNNPGDSQGCIVVTAAGFLTQARLAVSEVLSAMPNMTFPTTREQVFSLSSYIAAGADDGRLTWTQQASSTLLIDNPRSGYRFPLPITFEVQSPLEQPKLDVGGRVALREGQSTVLTVGIDDLARGYLIDRDIIARFKIAPTGATEPVYGQDYRITGANIRYFDASGTEVSAASVGVAFFEVTIKGGQHGVPTVGQNDVRVTVQAIADGVSGESASNVTFELVGYQTQRTNTAGVVTVSTPPGQSMLPTSVADRKFTVTIYDQAQGNSASNNAQGGLDYVVTSATSLGSLTPTASVDKLTLLGSGNMVLPSGIENAQLSGAYAANVTGNALDNVIDGNDGANSITAGAGNDTVKSGGGNDWIVAGSGAGDDVYDGGPDVDTISYASATQSITLNLVSGLVTGAEIGTDRVSRIENVVGGSGGDSLTGDAAGNLLDGLGGADVMAGGFGNDIYVADNAGDRVIEAVGGGSDRVATGVSYVLAAGQEIEVFTTNNAASTSAIDLTGNEFANYIIGNAGANRIDGKVGADTMQGAGGNDIYLVDSAADLVLEAVGGGYDRVATGVSYVLAAGQEIELFTTDNAGGTGAINLTGNQFANTIGGNAGANTIDGRGGADIMQGLGGNDLYHVENTGDQVFEGAGAGYDRVAASVSYVLAAGQEIELFTTNNTAGTTAIDLTGNEFANVIVGNAGANRLDGRGGADVLQGLGGNDIYLVDNAGDKVTEAAGGGYDRVATGVSYVLAAGQEIELFTTNNVGSTSAISLTGNEFANSIAGNAGANTIDGRGGADILQGLGGNDIYLVDHAGDQVTEAVGGGYDRVATGISYVLAAGQEIELFTTTNHAGLTAIDLTGNEFANSIVGNAGANRLDGRGGADTMQGLGGNDIYLVDNAGDQVIEAVGGGYDRIATGVSYALAAGQQIESLTTTNHAGLATIDLTGNEFDNAVVGNAGANRIDGRGGADVMQGFGGSDIYLVDNAADLVIEAIGGGYDRVATGVSYVLAARQEIELFTTNNATGTSAINLTGNELVNSIAGNAGANTIDGRGGADTLHGLGGNDTFVFRAGEAQGDVVGDFVGNSASVGDSIRFVGYGTAAQGATFVQLNATQWQVNSADGQMHETLTFSNGSAIHVGDFLFV